MTTNTAIRYKGFTFQPIIRISNEKVEGAENWYEYLIEGRRGKRKVLLQGSGLYQSPEGASQAAIRFAKAQIDEHAFKYEKSFLYRTICLLGYCPASKFRQARMS